jgi:hypothetical protein
MKFPTQINRENISTNREFSSKNREFARITAAREARYQDRKYLAKTAQWTLVCGLRSGGERPESAEGDDLM